MKLSFIIPAKNEAKNIEACIASINLHCNDIEDYEIIVVDNDSTDTTKWIASKAGAYIVSCPFDNIAKIRNFGAKHASGDWFIFLDADTLITREVFLSMNLVEPYIGGGSRLSILEDSFVGKLLCGVWNKFCKKKKWFTGSFIFVNKFWFQRAGGFNENLYICEDIEFSNILNNLALEKQKVTQYINNASVKTSARKLYLFTLREHVKFWFSLIFNFKNTIIDRSKCFIWYEIRR